MLSEKVGFYARLYALHVRKSCPECSVLMQENVKKGLCEVTGEKKGRM